MASVPGWGVPVFSSSGEGKEVYVEGSDSRGKKGCPGYHDVERPRGGLSVSLAHTLQEAKRGVAAHNITMARLYIHTQPQPTSLVYTTHADRTDRRGEEGACS